MSENKSVLIKFDSKLIQHLDVVSRRRGLSRSSLVRMLVIEGLERMGEKIDLT